MTKTTCPVCDTTSATVFTELLNLPIYCNLLWRDRDEAIACPKGDIRLAFCDTCGAITNTVFDPNKLGYSQDYENSLHYSARFQDYAQTLAERLVEKHQLHHKTIIEIGCGKGDFLVSLCELGNNKGVGFDNSYAERDEHEEMCVGEASPWENRIQFIQDFYSDKYAHYSADFVCCRQVLEHVKRPDELLIPVGKAVANRPNTTLFFEVPNGLYTFGNMMIWDIIYEHCTYFTPVSLTYAFNATGYKTSAASEEFGGQFLSIEANLSSERSETEQSIDSEALAEIATTIEGFESRFKAQKQQWEASLRHLFEQGKKIVVWGSGSKGVTFLNLLGLTSTIQGGVEYTVDINPRKQGKFIPGTGQEIVAPERMKGYQPDVVIVMNPLYQQEIKDSLSQMNLTPQLVTTESFVV